MTTEPQVAVTMLRVVRSTIDEVMSGRFPQFLSKEYIMWSRAPKTLMLCGLIGFATLAVAQSNSGANPPHLAAAPVAASAANAQQPGSGPQLGDLSRFRVIAVDTLRIVNTGDLDAAKKRIKDLELSWDQAEPKMKPLAPEKWQTVDAAIDRALKQVRAWRTTPAVSSEALQALIATIDGMK